jgi:hypothetical protein
MTGRWMADLLATIVKHAGPSAGVTNGLNLSLE